MDHANAFDLKVKRCPEGKDGEKADDKYEQHSSFRHWFVRWNGRYESGPDVSVFRGML